MSIVTLTASVYCDPSNTEIVLERLEAYFQDFVEENDAYVEDFTDTYDVAE